MPLARSDDVFVDRVVYAGRWAQLVGDCLKEWKGSAARLRRSPDPFLASGFASFPLLTVSGALFVWALGASLSLDQVYDLLPSQGSAALGVPANCLYVLFEYFGRRASAGLAGLAAFGILLLCGITSPAFQHLCMHSVAQESQEPGSRWHECLPSTLRMWFTGYEII
ncbi:hypothetical protein C8R47DRAFT_1068127 [Mycena vitilis]|nr:hypothetical protein C8R47DRAFT_1068127 [Mycena vitilis]